MGGLHSRNVASIAMIYSLDKILSLSSVHMWKKLYVIWAKHKMAINGHFH